MEVVTAVVDVAQGVTVMGVGAEVDVAAAVVEINCVFCLCFFQ